MDNMTPDERMGLILKAARTLGLLLDNEQPNSIHPIKGPDEVFYGESDEDLINLHIRQLGGCIRCERER